MVALKDMMGFKSGRLTVVSRSASPDNFARWDCICDCGKKTNVRGSALRNGRILSCGCLRSDKSRSIGLKNTTHGYCRGSTKRLYNIFGKMISRCNNKKNQDYINYGGRGIEVEFDSIKDFVDWALINGYDEKLTIERVDVNGNYSANNCTWITNEAQSLNRTNSKRFTYKGETKDIRSWADEYGIKYNTLRSRLNNYNWSIERALMTPSGGKI